MSERTEGLRKDVKQLIERIEHLAAEARRLEAGTVEEKEKFDAERNFVGCERTTKFQPNAAVAYWKEVRESEKRLDELRAELRTLHARGSDEPITVDVNFNARGQEED